MDPPEGRWFAILFLRACPVDRSQRVLGEGALDVRQDQLLVLLLVGAVVGLLVVVMRALLTQATVLRTDMDAVI